jgi:predicted small lipoprotein YifL
MFRVVRQILVSAMPRAFVLSAGVVVLLAACGQKGPLFMPTGPAAANRASLPQTLAPSTAVSTPMSPASAPPPPTGTAAPVRNP